MALTQNFILLYLILEEEKKVTHTKINIDDQMEACASYEYEASSSNHTCDTEIKESGESNWNSNKELTCYLVTLKICKKTIEIIAYN